jgi:MoaA/NifB/PqqE/SkfB family radical SAM enzyme
MPVVCNYYVTLRCNDSCEFCAIWSNEEYQKIEEKPLDLMLLKRAGIKRLNLTGGEPLLREDLIAILTQAKGLGFEITLTTNGILYSEKARALAGLLNTLYFSLDYPMASEHDRSRGIECFSVVIQAVELARKLGENAILNFTLTRDSVRFLPEMLELAEKLKTFLYLNPVYDFYGTQGFEPATIEHIKYYARRKGVLVNLAALEFIKAGGNQTLYPRCRAQETTLTLLPDGRQLSPCFFNSGGRQGREPVCSSCMRWPYMLPSFRMGLDRYRLLDWYSRWRQRQRRKKI